MRGLEITHTHILTEMAGWTLLYIQTYENVWRVRFPVETDWDLMTRPNLINSQIMQIVLKFISISFCISKFL